MKGVDQIEKQIIDNLIELLKYLINQLFRVEGEAQILWLLWWR